MDEFLELVSQFGQRMFEAGELKARIQKHTELIGLIKGSEPVQPTVVEVPRRPRPRDPRPAAPAKKKQGRPGYSASELNEKLMTCLADGNERSNAEVRQWFYKNGPILEAHEVARVLYLARKKGLVQRTGPSAYQKVYKEPVAQ